MDLAAPDLFYPVIGYKVLRFANDTPVFSAQGLTFKPGPNKARCYLCEDPRQRHRHIQKLEKRFAPEPVPEYRKIPLLGGVPPVQEHRCGLHSWYQLEYALNYFMGGVVGIVISWGRMLFDIEFMRAEYQQLIALSELPGPESNWPFNKTFEGRRALSIASLQQQAAHRYGVPILPPEELEDYAKQYGCFYRE